MEIETIEIFNQTFFLYIIKVVMQRVLQLFCLKKCRIVIMD